jgi:dTDP-4-dehydrorhamnose reductase
MYSGLQVIAIIGSSGQLGQDLLRVFGDRAVALSHTDLDVTSIDQLNDAFGSLRPEWVINCAAFHRVEECELNAALSLEVNAVGAWNVAKAAASIGAGVVFYSTDYVHSGRGRERCNPYSEYDVPEPLNVYGISKLAGEKLVARCNPKHLVIRSAGLYGTVTSRKGWTFPELMIHKARTEGYLRVVADQVLSPTFTVDLARMTLELISQNASGLFHVANSGECSWFEFARRVIALANIQVSIEPIDTILSPDRALRPNYSALTSERIQEFGVQPLRTWSAALECYLRDKGIF